MGRLDNHRDVSGFEPTRRVFQFHKAHEDVFAGLQSAARTSAAAHGRLEAH